MSVSIRLAKFGRKHAPAYKLVVSNTRDKRNGRFLDVIGHYNPSENPIKFEYNKEKYEEWKKTGALVTKAVEELIAGKYSPKPHDPHKLLQKKEKEDKEKETKDKEIKEEVVEEVKE